MRPVVGWMVVNGRGGGIHAETYGFALCGFALWRVGNEKPRATAGLIKKAAETALETVADFQADCDGLVAVEVG